jgi:hypothetical protein
MKIIKLQMPVIIAITQDAVTWGQLQVTEELLKLFAGNKVIYVEGNITGKNKEKLLVKRLATEEEYLASERPKIYRLKDHPIEEDMIMEDDDPRAKKKQ